MSSSSLSVHHRPHATSPSLCRTCTTCVCVCCVCVCLYVCPSTDWAGRSPIVVPHLHCAPLPPPPAFCAYVLLSASLPPPPVRQCRVRRCPPPAVCAYVLPLANQLEGAGEREEGGKKGCGARGGVRSGAVRELGESADAMTALGGVRQQVGLKGRWWDREVQQDSKVGRTSRWRRHPWEMEACGSRWDQGTCPVKGAAAGLETCQPDGIKGAVTSQGGGKPGPTAVCMDPTLWDEESGSRARKT